MRITEVETIPLNLPVRTPLVESGGTFSAFQHVIVRVATDVGAVGLGEVEAYPSFERDGVETQAGIVAILAERLVPCLLGQSPFDLARIWQEMDRSVVGDHRVKAALDIALHDLMGRALGRPVFDLIGGAVRDEYIVEGVGYGISIGEPEEVAAIAAQAVADGYRQLELKAGDARPERDIERLERVRARIGRDIPIKIDFNGFYDNKTALRLIRELEKLGVEWIEQPCKHWDIEGLAFIRNAVGVRIVVDESVETAHDMMRVARHQAADCVHIKPTIKGGFTGARRIAAVAEAAGIAIVPGTSAPTGLGMAAAHAFIATCPELSGGAHGSPLDILVEDIVMDPVPRGSTVVKIARGPGLGVELDERAIAKYRVG